MKRIILYIRDTNVIGGIETFIYNFSKIFSKKYKISVYLKNKYDQRYVDKLRRVAEVLTGPQERLECDTLIMCRVLDPIPEEVSFKKVIRRIHSLKACGLEDVPHDADVTVAISEAVKEDFDLHDAVVINNLIDETASPTLMLMSATRVPAPDKGDNEKRMRILCNKLNAEGIPFIWLNFSDGALEDPPANFYNVGMRDDIRKYLKKADYLVQLSTYEAFCNSVLEALTVNTPVIVTWQRAYKDFGVEDGVNAHVVPMDMEFDVRKLLEIPKFEYKYDNMRRIKQWEEIL
jgi:glycosyltransferase involved in cell wall biosynthesis